jgi:hypothetical protein
MKSNWSPTQESLEKLLKWLDSNREEAGHKYVTVRLRLLKYFACNGCADDDETLSDKTIDRVMKKLDLGDVPEPFTGDKILYFFAFAKNIRQEHFESRKPREPAPPIIIDPLAEAVDACLEHCVRILGQEDRWLATEYYRFEKSTKVDHHRMLAEQFGLTLQGLRTRIFRVRERLKPCIEDCLDRR